MAWYDIKPDSLQVKAYLLNLSNLFAFTLVIILHFLKSKYKLFEYVSNQVE